MNALVLCFFLFASSFAAQQQSGCSLCQLVVTYVDSYVQQNASQAQIIQELETVCALLGSGKAACDGFVETYVPQMIQYLLKGYPPAKFCATIGLCSPQLTAGVPCSLCTMVIQYIEQFVQNNATVAEIEHSLDQICALLGSELAQPCVAFVASETPAMIQWLIQGNSPATFCAEVGLCSSNDNVHKHGLIAVPETQTTGGACSLCELVVQYAESYIQSNMSTQQIIKELDVVCAALGPIGPECVSLVALYVPQLIQWILDGENPQAFCTQVGLCSSVALYRKKIVVKGEAICSICETLAALVETYVASASTEAKMEAELAKACQGLGPFAAECSRLVDAYLPQLISAIVAKVQPAVLCARLSLC